MLTRVAFVDVVLTSAVLTGPSAHAYIDPGSGSYLFQLLMGALLASAFSVRMFWRRLKARLRR